VNKGELERSEITKNFFDTRYLSKVNLNYRYGPLSTQLPFTGTQK